MTDQPSKLAEPKRGDQQIRRALRRFFAAVDNALTAAREAQQERELLERLTGGSITDSAETGKEADAR